MKRYFCYIVLSVFFSLCSYASSEIKGYDVTEMLNEDNRRIVLGCEALYSNTFEEEDVSKIVDLAECYNIVPMRKIVTLRRNRQMDKGNELLYESLHELVDSLASKEGDSVKYGEVYARILLAMTMNVELLRKESSLLSYETAKKLLENDESIYNKELLYVSKLLYIAHSSVLFGPTKFEEFKRTFDSLCTLYDNNNIHSFLRQEVGNQLMDYVFYMYSRYKSYCDYIDQKLKGEKSYTFYPISVEGLYQSSQDEVCKRKKPNHPDRLQVEANACLHKISTSEKRSDIERNLSKLDTLKLEAYNYYGSQSYIPNYLSFVHAMYSIRQGKLIPELTEERLHELQIIKEGAGENYELIISALNDALGTFINKNSECALQIFTQMESLAEEMEYLDNYGYFSAMCNKMYLLNKGIPGYENSYEELKFLLNEYRQEGVNWSYINKAHDLLYTALSIYGKTESSLELNQLVYDSECELLSESNALNVFCGLNYAGIKRFSMNVIEDNAFEPFLDNLENEALQIGIETSLISFERVAYYLAKGDKIKGKEILSNAIEECSNQELTDIFYTLWMLNFAAEYPDDILTMKGYEYLKKTFAAEQDDLRPEHMEVYYALAQYYGIINKRDLCYQVLQTCVNYYHKESIVPDQNYTMFVMGLTQIYATGYGTLEDCRTLLNEILHRMEDVRAFVDYESYLTILRNCYDLAEMKTPDDFAMLASILIPMIQAYEKFFYENNNSEDLLWNHLPYLIVKISNVYRAMRTSFERMSWKTPEQLQMLESARNQYAQFIEGVKSMCNDVNNSKSYLKSSDSYYNLLLGLGQMYEYLMDDQEQADHYYRQMKELRSPHGETWYMGYLMRQNKWGEALDIATTLTSKFDSEEKRMLQMNNLSSFSKVTSMLFMVYYKNGHYEEAMYYADLYLEIRKNTIDTNFDYFTTQERESYIAQGGAGGWPTYVLLGHINNEEINAKAYNSALHEKCLLLRSSERVRNAIMNSGDDKLIQSIESIQRLNQSLMAIMDTNDSESIKHAAEIRKEIDDLEHYVSMQTVSYKDGLENVPTWIAVRDALRKDEAAIEFVFGDSVYYALVITPECKTPKRTRILNPNDMDRIMSYYEDQGAITENMKQMYEKDGKLLYNAIWEPLLPYIGNAKNVFYSPTGILNSISFNALQLEDGSYLMDHYNLRQLSTTANLVRRSERKEKQVKSAAVIGGLCYEDIQLENVEDEIAWAQNNSNPVVAQREALQSFEFLPFSYLEKENISNTLSELQINVENKSLMDATEIEIRKLLYTKPTILHISTHGFSYIDEKQAREVPYFANTGQLTTLNVAGIALSAANPVWEGEVIPKENDNILTADEISVMDLRDVELTILSACNTALGATSNEGVMGLQRGLKQSGVQTLCLSLWSVNDASSATLMSNFYNNWLKNKKSKSVAMREAMTTQRALTPSPYYWAPFILIDDIE